MSMVTDPDHIREGEIQVRSKVYGFPLSRCFGRPEDAQEIADMKGHYQRGGLGDVKTKRYLLKKY